MRPVTLSREVKLDSTPFHIFCKQQRWRLGFFVLGLFRETIKKSQSASMQPPCVARVGDMQSVTLHRAESIVVNKLAVTFRPRRGGRICFFTGPPSFLETFFHSLGGLLLEPR